MKISISTDSTSDLPKELCEKYGINIMPLIIILGETEHREGEITNDDIYDFVTKTKNLPKTAANSSERYKGFFEKIMKNEGSTAHIHFSLSSKISSSFEFAAHAAQELGNIHVIDTKSLSSGCGLLVLSCIDKINAGADLETILNEINGETKRVQASFIIDKLEFLYKGGRCSALAMLGANILGIKPSIALKKGAMDVNKKYLGKLRNSVMKYVEDTLKDNPNPNKKRAFVTYTTMDKDIINQIKDRLIKAGFEEIIEQIAGATITCHCGRGTIGVLFINNA